MHKANPLLRIPAMQVPKVDCFMLDYLKQRFPKSCDEKLGTVQSALLYAVTCLWSDLLDNNCLNGKGEMINTHNVLNVVQCTLVLLGNA